VQPLDQLVRICLAKDPEERYSSAHDVRLQLRHISIAPPSTTPHRSRSVLGIAGGSAAAFAALALVWMQFRRRPPEPRSVRFAVQTEARLPMQATISPDGTRLAFLGQNAQATNVLWIRPLDKGAAQPLAGTEGANHPFWSPDGRRIG